MSQSSSTSSSDAIRPQSPGRFALGVLGLCALGVAVCVALIETSLHHGREALPSQVLVEFQNAKAHSLQADTVFVGDSSLGNSIDAQVWSGLSGHSVANLALTGYYGYAGSYHMLRRVLQHGRPRQVVIMHTPDMASRLPSSEAELLARDPAQLSWSDSLATRWRVHVNPDQLSLSVRHLARIASGKAAAPSTTVVDADYIRQGAPMSLSAHEPGLDRRAVQPRALEWLSKLRELCRSERLQCVYVHGPVYEGVCRESRQYLARVNAALARQGWNHATGSPVCMSAAEVGDSLDHVRPGFKADYTRRYFKLVSQGNPQAVSP